MSQLSEERIWLSDSGDVLVIWRGESCVRSIWLVPMALVTVVLPSSPVLLLLLLELLLVSRRLL